MPAEQEGDIRSLISEYESLPTMKQAGGEGRTRLDKIKRIYDRSNTNEKQSLLDTLNGSSLWDTARDFMRKIMSDGVRDRAIKLFPGKGGKLQFVKNEPMVAGDVTFASEDEAISRLAEVTGAEIVIAEGLAEEPETKPEEAEVASEVMFASEDEAISHLAKIAGMKVMITE